jgi:hypothetical protein
MMELTPIDRQNRSVKLKCTRRCAMAQAIGATLCANAFQLERF